MPVMDVSWFNRCEINWMSMKPVMEAVISLLLVEVGDLVVLPNSFS